MTDADLRAIDAFDELEDLLAHRPAMSRVCHELRTALMNGRDVAALQLARIMADASAECRAELAAMK